MYFLVSLGLAIIAGVLWFFFKDRKALHLDVLTIIFGAAALMWFIDCIFTAAGGEPFLDFEDEKGGWISLWTLLGGVGFWLLLSFIFNNKDKKVAA